MIAVNDSGIGMNDKIKKRIFEPFFTTKEQGKGTGLGLSTVFGIAKQNNAYVTIYSEPGRGAAFKIFWPAALKETPVTIIDKSDKVILSGNETILLVEDDENVRKFSCAALRTSGYTVYEAENGVEALELIKEENLTFELLITDLIMPKMNGDELASKVKEIFPAASILFTSGYTDNHMLTTEFCKKE